MRRLFWFVVAVATGAVIALAFLRSANKARKKYAPAAVATRAGGRAKSLGDRFREALQEGRAEMMLREAELRSEIGLDP
ncbi:MAG: hypothetical protein ACLGH3_00570 [Actinomycetota bacterium]